MTRFGKWGQTVLGIALVLWAASSVRALDPDTSLAQYDRRAWGLEEGLPQSTVLAITQTFDGFLWMATLEGVVRFDGVTFENVDTAWGLPRGPATAVTVDGAGRLWVAVADRLFVREGAGFREQTIDGPVEAVCTLLPAQRGGVWICPCSAPLMWTDGETSEAVIYDSRGQEVRNVFVGASRGTQTCFGAEAVYCLDDEPGPRPIAHRVSPGGFDIRGLAFDRSGTLWAGTMGDGILGWDSITIDGPLEGPNRRVGPADGAVLALLIDRDGQVWAGYGGLGLGRIEADGQLSSLGTSLVRSLFEDRQGNLWGGTNTAGVLRLSDRPVTHISASEGLQRASVQSVLESRDGTIWVGVEASGLAAIVDGEVVRCYTLDDGLPSLDVLSLAEDGEGRLWVGTTHGVAVQREGRFEVVPASEIGPVFALHSDREGTVWAGSIERFHRLGPAGFEPVEAAPGGVDAIVEGADGTLWIGGVEGLWRRRGDRFEQIGDDEPGPQGRILGLLPDADGLWVASRDEGLGRWFSNGRYGRLGSADGLCDDMVFTVVDDGAGRLWMSSNRGLFSVEREAALGALSAPPGTADLACRLLGPGDQVRVREANGGLQPSAWHARDGTVWFATVNGAVGIDPVALTTTVEPPPVVVDRIEAGDRRLTVSGLESPVLLSPAERDFAISYTALDLTAPSRLQFRYRLRGHRDTWVETGTRRTAYFTNLSPGDYVFEASVRSADGPWTEPTSFALALAPRFRETPLFALLLTVALFGAIVAGHRWRVAGITRRQVALEQAVAARTLDLEQAREALEQANTTLEARVAQGVAALRQRDRMAAYGRLVAGVVHELRHPIFSLQTVAHLLDRKLEPTAEVGAELDLLGRETGRMKRLLDDLLELARPQSSTLVATDLPSLLDEVRASYEAAGAAQDVAALPVEIVLEEPLPEIEAERERLVQVLLNLLDNARRHARNASIVVLTAARDERDGRTWLRMTIADDGEGLSEDLHATMFEPFVSSARSTGLGLAIARKTIESHGGTIEARAVGPSGADSGTTIVMYLPALDDGYEPVAVERGPA